MPLGARLKRELALAVFFLAAALVFTWPLARVLSSGVADLGDPLLNAWIVDWVQHALVHQPLHLFDAPVFYPAKFPLAYSENMLAIAILMLPFRALGLGPIAIYNVAIIIGFAVAAYGASVLARTAGASVFAAIIAALGYAFCQFFFDHVPHLQVVWSGWLPLILASLIHYWRFPSWKNASLAAAVFLANALTNVYFMLFAAAAVGATLVFFLIGGPRRLLRDLVRLAVAFAIAGAVLYPVLSPYKTVAKLYDMRRGTGEVAAGSATWIDWMTSSGRSAVYGRVEPPGDHGERRLFPGIVPILMTLVAVFATPFVIRPPASDDRLKPVLTLRILDAAALIVIAAILYMAAMHTGIHTRFVAVDLTATPVLLLFAIFVARCSIRIPRAFTRGEDRSLRDAVALSRFDFALWAAAIWIVLGFAGSFGSNGPLHMWLYQHVYPFKSLRAVGRWAVITYAGLIPWSALGIDLLAKRRRIIGVLIAMVMVSDIATKLRWENAPLDPTPVYEWMAKEKVEGPFLELPMEGDNAEYVYMLGSTVHHRMLVNGTSGFEPALHMTLRDMTRGQEFNDVLLALLEQNRIRYVIIHGDRIGKRDILGSWLGDGFSRGKLALVRRFDHGAEGDFLIAVTKSSDAWKRYAAPTSEGEKLVRFLAHVPVRNESLFGVLETPTMMSTVFQRLEVTGWALSPSGIRKVDVEINSAGKRYAAALVPRPDVNRAYPWYGNQKAGFSLVIPKRPKGMPREVDVQVVVTDNAGRVMHMRDMLVTWH